MDAGKKHAIEREPYLRRQHSEHTVPNPQAHAVSHSVAQGDHRQFSDWPRNGFLTSDLQIQSQPDYLNSASNLKRAPTQNTIQCLRVQAYSTQLQILQEWRLVNAYGESSVVCLSPTQY